MNEPRWRNVLFDLDGTLADTVPLILASYEHTFQTVLGKSVDKNLAITWIGRTLADAFNEYDPAHAAEMERVYLEFNGQHLKELATGFDGIPDLLQTLYDAGTQIGIVTSKRRSVARATIEVAGLPKDIMLAVGMEDTTAHKPNPEPILAGIKAMDADPTETVYVGDAVVDLQAAANANIAGVGVLWGAGAADEMRAQPNAGIAATVDELATILIK